MRRIVINACFGGFGLSPAATLWLWEHGAGVEVIPVEKYYGHRVDDGGLLGMSSQLAKWREYKDDGMKGRMIFITVFTPDESSVISDRDIKRDDPKLIECIETLGESANGSCAELKIVEIPDDVDWEISEYDGNEHVAEKHGTWS